MTRHLIHIGYPKAGSSFLQLWFQQHPDLRYVPGGVAGFHSVYEMCRRSGESYSYHVTSSESLSTPSDSAGMVGAHGPGERDIPDVPIRERQAQVCALLRDLNPGSRVLIVTRGFRGMILSSYSQFVRSGGRLGLEAMCSNLSATVGRDEGHYFDYDYLIGLYIDAFGDENVIVLPYELLRDDQDAFLRTLEEQLGVRHAPVESGRVNESLSPEDLYWYPRISRAAATVSSALPPRLGNALYRRYTERTFNARLGLIVRVLSRATPGREVTRGDVPASALESCEGRATRLRSNPLYASYAAEYLWT
ncbi:MAG: hypothetical protein ABI625_01480 [bacterium]